MIRLAASMLLTTFVAIGLSACDPGADSAGAAAAPSDAAPDGSESPGSPDASEARAREETAAVEVPRYTIEEFLETVNHGGLSFSPDNSKVLVHSNETGVFNLFALSTDGAEREQLTDSTTDTVFSAGYFPSDERALFLSDQGGNELFHVFVREIDGSVRDLTPGDGHRAVPSGWTYDLSRLLISTNERDERFMDLYVYDPATYEREMIYRNDDGLIYGGMSPNRRYLALAKALTNADTDLYLHDLETGETELVTDDAEPVTNSPAGFAPDGRLLYLTNRDSEFQFAVARDVETGAETVLARPDWDVMSVDYSYGGRYLITRVNVDARTELTLIDTESGAEVELPEIPDASVQNVRVSRDESVMGMYVSSSRMPGDLVVQDLSGGEPAQLTHSLAESIDPAHLVDGEVVRFESFDGLEIPGVLYMPHAASAENKVPALVWVHGGPGGQSRVGYVDVIQYMVNQGYAIFAINNRGSSGYGKTFFHMDDRAHGEGDLDDCVASRQMLIDTGLVDPDRIGIIGGSYGGYMVLAAQAFRPGTFEVGVDIFGVSNWLRTLQSIPAWWEAQREALSMEMGEFDDEEYLRSISPLFHAENIVDPLLVIQGANDPRVLQVESDEIVEAVRANGVDVEYIVFDDEGHGFTKKENQSVAYRAIVDFLGMRL